MDGVSKAPTQFPNMAGQTAAAFYRQLNDYRSGARKYELMQDVASKLSLEQLVAVAAYYAELEPARWDQTWVQVATPAATQLARAGGPIETPVLFGQTREYFTGQMNASPGSSRRPKSPSLLLLGAALARWAASPEASERALRDQPKRRISLQNKYPGSLFSS